MNRLLILWEEMETLSRRLNDDYLRMKQWKLTRLHEACPTRRLTRRYSTKEAVLALARVKEREGTVVMIQDKDEEDGVVFRDTVEIVRTQGFVEGGGVWGG